MIPDCSRMLLVGLCRLQLFDFPVPAAALAPADVCDTEMIFHTRGDWKRKIYCLEPWEVYIHTHLMNGPWIIYYSHLSTVEWEGDTLSSALVIQGLLQIYLLQKLVEAGSTHWYTHRYHEHVKTGIDKIQVEINQLSVHDWLNHSWFLFFCFFLFGIFGSTCQGSKTLPPGKSPPSHRSLYFMPPGQPGTSEFQGTSFLWCYKSDEMWRSQEGIKNQDVHVRFGDFGNSSWYLLLYSGLVQIGRGANPIYPNMLISKPGKPWQVWKVLEVKNGCRYTLLSGCVSWRPADGCWATQTHQDRYSILTEWSLHGLECRYVLHESEETSSWSECGEYRWITEFFDRWAPNHQWISGRDFSLWWYNTNVYS